MQNFDAHTLLTQPSKQILARSCPLDWYCRRRLLPLKPPLLSRRRRRRRGRVWRWIAGYIDLCVCSSSHASRNGGSNKQEGAKKGKKWSQKASFSCQERIKLTYNYVQFGRPWESGLESFGKWIPLSVICVFSV